jgi:hypothetical protein
LALQVSIIEYNHLGFNHHAFIFYNRVQVAGLYDRWATQEFPIERRPTVARDVSMKRGGFDGEKFGTAWNA